MSNCRLSWKNWRFLGVNGPRWSILRLYQCWCIKCSHLVIYIYMMLLHFKLTSNFLFYSFHFRISRIFFISSKNFFLHLRHLLIMTVITNVEYFLDIFIDTFGWLYPWSINSLHCYEKRIEISDVHDNDKYLWNSF